MKLSNLSSLLTVSLALILSGCGGSSPMPPEEAVVDSSLPKIVLTKKGTKSTMMSIALEWDAIKDKRVRGIYVYKKSLDLNASDGDEYIETIESRFSTHYLDKNVEPNTEYIYYFKTYSDEAESLKSKEFTAKTRPVIKSVSWIYAREDMPRSAKIIWRPHKNKSVKFYSIERKTLEGEEFEEIARVDGRLRAEYIDTDLKDKFTYIYQIRALTCHNLTSLPSESVTVTTKALPSDIKGISATTDLAKKIKIKWKKNKAPDFLNYNVYKSDSAESGFELIAQIKENFYTDAIDEDGGKYFYRVSIVDKDGLESNHETNSAQGMALVKPTAPALLEAKLVDDKIVLKWSQTDDRTKKYLIKKHYKKGMFDSVEDEFDTSSPKFTDSDIMPNTTYTYSVLAVDKNGISSEPSIEVEFETKEIAGYISEVEVNEVQEVTPVEVAPLEEETVIQIEVEDEL